MEDVPQEQTTTAEQTAPAEQTTTTKAGEWPHPDDGICSSLSCDPCQHRILKITCKFFQDEYRKMLQAQYSKANICLDNDCKICNYGFPERMTCPGCGARTGKTRQGLLGLEVGQIHNIPEHMTMNGNIKPCECIVHMKLYIICSAECHKKSIFRESIHQGNFTYTNPKGGPEIPESGPVCTTQNYAAKKPTHAPATSVPETPAAAPAQTSAKPADPKAPKCVVCGKATDTKCSRCKKAYFCSQACQKENWRYHKAVCVPPTAQ
eukprot:Phypoly_transcript_15519.p1 GENE.Phypoly_transcript_15519~~Phypoly_transcript_15519.p1  ORF type:complete len:264 (+),score=46.40 Phypoly_transcript_15519:107-898(+)